MKTLRHCNLDLCANAEFVRSHYKKSCCFPRRIICRDLFALIVWYIWLDSWPLIRQMLHEGQQCTPHCHRPISNPMHNVGHRVFQLFPVIVIARKEKNQLPAVCSTVNRWPFIWIVGKLREGRLYRQRCANFGCMNTFVLTAPASSIRAKLSN